MTAKKYRKIPVEIEAFHFADDIIWKFLLAWANYLVRYTDTDLSQNAHCKYYVYDRLHDTWVEFEVGDYIVKGVQGEFYPVKADIFRDTYEAVDNG